MRRPVMDIQAPDLEQRLSLGRVPGRWTGRAGVPCRELAHELAGDAPEADRLGQLDGARSVAVGRPGTDDAEVAATDAPGGEVQVVLDRQAPEQEHGLIRATQPAAGPQLRREGGAGPPRPPPPPP